MGDLAQLKQKCYDLGKAMPNGVSHETLIKLLAKIIVQEKIHDEDAFEIASKAYSDSFLGLGQETIDSEYEKEE